MGKLKFYAVVMGIGAVLGITVAEIWRRKVRHDSYLSYLPPPGDRDATPTPDHHARGRMRQAANRVWSPVADSATTDWARVRRRLRTGPFGTRIGAPVPRGDQRELGHVARQHNPAPEVPEPGPEA
jgi:hypothetical protein